MSCSLKEKITSYTEGDKYYRSVEQIKTGLNACYSPLKLIYTNMGFWEMCECATDLMYLNIDNQIDAVCDIAPAVRVPHPLSGSAAIRACPVPTV